MVEKTRISKLLIFIFVFSLTYRLLLLTINRYPPGSDIGLHESVVNSIAFEKTDFFWNSYHMGGETSATNPGYHIFVAFIRAFTGMPDYLSHVLVVSFYSSFNVLCAFLITRRLWSYSASLIAAFLAVFSGGDIEMLCWGGYPNLLALLLIAIVLYFCLQYPRFSIDNHFMVVSLLASDIYLTHVFSALVFTAIVFLALFLFSIARKGTCLTKEQVVYWVAPIIIGALIVSPYLVKMLPVYFGSSGTIIDAPLETREALIQNRLVPAEYLIIAFLFATLFFVFSKLYKGKYITISSILFAAWIITPTIFTQSYLIGLYADYRRFVYFVFFPVIICLSLIVDRIPQVLFKLGEFLFNRRLGKPTISNINEPKRGKSSSLSNRYLAICAFLLLGSLFFAPVLTAPTIGFEKAAYYQVMTPQKFDAIRWIKANTPCNSVFVASAEYGWWISGFAQRPTLSAVDPQYLILARELEPAEVARNLLRSKYFIDNGVLRVEYNNLPCYENNFGFYTKLAGLSSLYQFFLLKDNQISLLYRHYGVPSQLDVSDLEITTVQLRNDSSWASVNIIRENPDLIFSESITLYSGVRFLKVSLELSSKVGEVLLDWLIIPILSNGIMVQYDGGVAFADQSAHMLNQLLFVEEKLATQIKLQENPDSYVLIKNLEGQKNARVEFFLGSSVFTVSENHENYIYSVIYHNSQTYFDSVINSEIIVFNYQNVLNAWNISYIVVTPIGNSQHLINDKNLNIVYKNSEVIIFKNKCL
ncbi:MAG: hypothetical protein WHU54_07765 [Candidatus Bathyarchaeia archaeon]